MRALTVVAVLAVGGMMLATGCGPKKQDLPQMEPAEVSAPATPMPAPEKVPVTVESPSHRTKPEKVERPAPVAKVTPPEPVPVKPPAAESAGIPSTYTFKEHDTLYALAKQFYGDGKLWTRIAEANKDKIKDVTKIPVGTVLAIPPK